MQKINVLGTEYTVEKCDRGSDKWLEKCDGYCDSTSKRIAVVNRPEDNELDDFDAYQRKVLRHEVIHAFLNESGLQANMLHGEFGSHDEQMVDWMAVQWPKICRVFVELEVLA